MANFSSKPAKLICQVAIPCGRTTFNRKSVRLIKNYLLALATLGGLLLITRRFGSAPPVTKAAYSFVRGVYVLQSSMCSRAQRKRPNFREFLF